MIIKKEILSNLTEDAKTNRRLRTNYCIHTSMNDKVHRMLNAMEPGTEVPIHMHSYTEETLLLLRGALILKLYDADGGLRDTVLLSEGSGNLGINIKKCEWHSIEVCQTGTVIFEIKEGPFRPLAEDEIMNKNK